MANTKLNILADENMPKVEAIFGQFGEVKRLPGREMTAADLADTDLLLVRSVTQVNQTLLDSSPVRFVGTATIGMDHIDQPYLQQRNIGFSNAPGCNADAVVDYVLSVIFLQAREQGFDPADRVYGIVGVGNVGGRLYQRLTDLGYQVLRNDPPRAEREPGFVDLDQLLEQADCLCLHTPLTREGVYPTQHLFAAPELAKLKPGTLLINAGRGPVIDNQALLARLSAEPDLTVALDVWEYEPAVSAELAKHCVQVSPHIAGYSLDGKIRGTFMLYQAFCQHLSIAPELTLEAFLPEMPHATFAEGDDPLDLMLSVYDPRVDDQLLRETLHLPETEQKQAFDQLRKHYRLRREFSALKVAATEQQSQLRALGFQLAD